MKCSIPLAMLLVVWAVSASLAQKAASFECHIVMRDVPRERAFSSVAE